MMNCQKIFALIVALLIGASYESEAMLRSSQVRLGSNPGAAIRLRKSAIDSLLDRGSYFLSRYVDLIPIPDMKATISGMQFETHSSKITAFDQPRLSIRLSPPDALEATFELPHVTMQTNFTSDRDVGFGRKEQDGGKIVFDANQVRSTFKLRFGQFDDSSNNNNGGLPKIESFDCVSTLGPAKMDVIGAKTRYPIQVLNLAAKGVRPIYQTQLCSLARSVVSDHLNWLLAKVPDVLPVNQRLAVKYQIQPVIGADFLQVNLYEKVITNTGVSAHAPAPFVESPDDATTLIAALLSDAMLNDALYQAYANRLLEFTVDQDSPALLYDLIRLRCASPDSIACLGNQMPDLAAKYGPDADVEFHFETAEAPEVEFVKGKATFRGKVKAVLDVTPSKGGKKTRELSADMDLAGALRVKIEGERIYGKLQVEKVDLKLDRDGDTAEQAERDAAKIRDTIKRIVEQHVNQDLLLKGFPLRLPFGMAFVNPLVKFDQHTLQIHTGFQVGGNGNGIGYGNGNGADQQGEEEYTEAAEPQAKPEPVLEADDVDANSADTQQK